MMTYYDLCEGQHEMYVANLIHNPDKGAMRYLLDRGFTMETILTYKLGATLTQRVVFPICNIEGRVCGFQTRDTTGTDTKTKYKNSENNDYFKKAYFLFGLHVAKEAIEKEKSVLVVEGNMDVMRLHQEGYKNVVGIMGSSMSSVQAKTLSLLTNNCVMMLDVDPAGLKGTMDAYPLLLESGIRNPTWVTFPEGVDPDRYFNGQRHMYGLVSFPIRESYIHYVRSKYNMKTCHGKFRFIHELANTLQYYPDKSDFINAVRGVL